MLMALNATSEAPVADTQIMVPPSSGTARPQTIALHRRRKSKGTIAGYGSSGAPDPTDTDNSAPALDDVVNLAASPAASGAGGSVSPLNGSRSGGTLGTDAYVGVPSPPGAVVSPGNGVSSVSNSDLMLPVSQKPSHSARLALLCTHNALRMGARTQLLLCPPGRGRRSLQQALRTRPDRQLSRNEESEFQTMEDLERMIGTENLASYDDQEEDYLLNTNTFDVDSDEEASSGDEDEMLDFDDLLADNSSALDNEQKYTSLQEPLFTPAGHDNSGSNSGGGMSSVGKLPFNQRKLRFFDTVTSKDRAKARKYLRQQQRNARKQDGEVLTRHLKRMQRRERRRLQVDRGESPDPVVEEDPYDLKSSVTKFNEIMSPCMAAALLLESLAMNTLESVEGMSKCYDGVVAAGVALLDASETPTPPTPKPNSGSSADNTEQKPRPSRDDIMAALAPLLITSLEQPSGDVIVQLARMRRMCGTPRYQRRFIQRVAPPLFRPPEGAMWCLRHQNDMEPILAAAELIFDKAEEVFSKGWYDRGQTLLQDSVRKETLNTAAQQLRKLSSDPDASSWGLNTGHRRGKFKKGQGKDAVRNNGEPLAEWEVIAVDRQIRLAISNLVSTQWPKVSLTSKDLDERSVSSRSRRTANTLASIGRARNAVEANPRSIGGSSPRSPARPKMGTTAILSSPKQHPTAGAAPAPDVESVFGPSFATLNPTSVVPTTTLSPESVPSQRDSPISPSQPQRFDGAKSPTPHTNTKTPPRSPPSSPGSKERKGPVPMSNAVPTAPSPIANKSPRKDTVRSPPPTSHRDVISSGAKSPSLTGPDRAPLSPSASSIVSEPVNNIRVVSSASSVTSVGSSGSQPAHYRMLTSTAAERKRTVAACRALRSQIQRFEDAFSQLHGRPPKGAAERAPLATTYAQYREWKRAIRADAACRIQALFRGARTRWMLLRSNNPRMAHVVMTRAGRRAVTTPGSKQDNTNVLKQLSIPTEIGSEVRRGIGLSPMPTGMTSSPSTSSLESAGAESFSPSSGAIGSANSPFSMSGSRRRTSSGDLATSPTPPFPGSPASSPPQDAFDVSTMSLKELQARKSDLKQQLKQYDMNFARQHGRMPVKAEKEPIRHLYEQYNSLKNQISLMKDQPPSTSTSTSVPKQPSAPPRIGRSPSPQSAAVASFSGADSIGSEEDTPVIARPKPKLKSSSETPTGKGGSGSQNDLAVLKSEKSRLHQMLRSYEKDFYKEHGRNVSSFTDIQPVASQYRRYKDIKKRIASLLGAQDK